MKQSLKTAIDLIKKYSRKSIFFGYLKKLFLLITLPFLIVLSGIYYYQQRVMNSEMMYSVNENFDRAAFLSDNMFNEFMNISLIYNENIYVQLFLNTSSETFLSSASDYIDHIYDRINLSTNTSNAISYISVYSFGSDYVLSNKGGGYVHSSSAHATWYNYYKKTGKTSFTMCTQQPGNSEKTLYAAFPLYSSREVVGMTVFEVSAEALNKMLLGNLSRSSHEFQIIDQNNMMVFSTSGKESAPFENEELLKKISEAESFNTFRHSGKLYASEPLDSQSNYTLIYTNDLSEMKYIQRNTYLLFALCVLLSLILPLAISLYVSMNFYNSIAKLITLLNVNDTESPSEVNEFAFISSHITDLLDKNKSIEEELLQRTSSFKQAQALALQSQLNPHFLFNTLHLIGLTSRVLLKGNNPVTTTVSLLSDLLTAALDTHSYIVTIEQELNYTKKYLEIQKIRYKDNFDVIWDIDEKILEYNTIKLILQPLIENSFQHGISMLDEQTRGELKISAQINDDGDIYFCVRDNGSRITEERLAKIRNKLETDDIPKKDNIGLANVNMRIKVIFGEKYGVRITSDEGGTSVSIVFPKE